MASTQETGNRGEIRSVKESAEDLHPCNTLQGFPWRVLNFISQMLDPISTIRASLTCRHLYFGLARDRKFVEFLPWRISIEYHFTEVDPVIHSTWISVGWGIYPGEGCEHCLNRTWYDYPDHERICVGRDYFGRFDDEGDEFFTNTDVQTFVISGEGGPTLRKILNNGPIIPIWFKLDRTNLWVVPFYVGPNLPAPMLPELSSYYFTDVKITVGSLLEVVQDEPSENDTDRRSVMNPEVDDHRLLGQIVELSPDLFVSGDCIHFVGVNKEYLIDNAFDYQVGPPPGDAHDEKYERSEGYNLDPRYYNFSSSSDDDSSSDSWNGPPVFLPHRVLTIGRPPILGSPPKGFLADPEPPADDQMSTISPPILVQLSVIDVPTVDRRLTDPPGGSNSGIRNPQSSEGAGAQGSTGSRSTGPVGRSPQSGDRSTVFAQQRPSDKSGFARPCSMPEGSIPTSPPENIHLNGASETRKRRAPKSCFATQHCRTSIVSSPKGSSTKRCAAPLGIQPLGNSERRSKTDGIVGRDTPKGYSERQSKKRRITDRKPEESRHRSKSPRRKRRRRDCR